MSQLRIVAEDRKREIERRIDTERLFAVIGTTGDITDQIAGIADALYEGGVSTSEVTCRAQTWLKHLEALQKYKETKNSQVIVAVGTNTDIFSVHQAMENGAEVIVAAHGLMPYAHRAIIPPDRRAYLATFDEFVRQHAGEVQELYGPDSAPYSLMMDPITYVRTRGGVIIPAADDLAGLKALKMRGAEYQKLYPTQAKTAEEWTEVFKAATPFDGLKVVLTGGLNQDNMVPYLKIPYVVAAGMSYLGRGTPQEIKEKARSSVQIVKTLS